MERSDMDSLLSPPPYESHLKTSYWHVVNSRRRRRLVLAVIFILGLLGLFFHEAALPRYPDNKHLDAFAKGLSACNKAHARTTERPDTSAERANPRWTNGAGQQHPKVLRNATLFDGDTILAHAVDIIFERGVITSVSKTLHQPSVLAADVEVFDLQGRFVTPGLVDIHSHHLETPFSSVPKTDDTNEKPNLGTITPFVRAIDGFKPYDPAIRIIASGGITSSLLLPGSGNVIGGQAFLVKNLPNPGDNQEPVVEELLFDHGLPEDRRQRYLKMACGENPKYRYGYTRLGNAWLLRKHLEKAQKLKGEQDAWCSAARDVKSARLSKSRSIFSFIQTYGARPQELELEASVALLNGDFNVNIHCYEPEDLERMLAVLHEFGVHPQAFHHALEAWQVPEFLKQQEPNITIATFAENALFKHEAYGANLRGPKILDDHDIRVVLKSDHFGEANHAKYLLHQAAVAHSFGLPEIKSLQAVTSVAAQSIQQDHRVGYTRPGYDADLVVWDAHPLSVGATPLQVYVDGREVLSSDAIKALSASNQPVEVASPTSRPSIAQKEREGVCAELARNQPIIFTGIKRSLLDAPSLKRGSAEKLALVIANGTIICLDNETTCLSSLNTTPCRINLNNGYVTPGFIAFGNNIGILDISAEPSTGDGTSPSPHALNPSKDLHYAKDGVHFGGRGFGRARIGGVTKAITAPTFSRGLLQGVSVGLRTTENVTLLHGGIWKDNVALHFAIGQEGKGDDTPTISSGIERLRQVLESAQQSSSVQVEVYTKAANGSLPIVIHAVNEDDIAQIVLLKRDFPAVNFVIYGGHGAPLVRLSPLPTKIHSSYMHCTRTYPRPPTRRLQKISPKPKSRSF